MGKRRNDRRTSRGRGLSKGGTWALLGVAVLGFAVYAAAPLWRPLFTAPPPPEALAAQGEALYTQHCATCHGPRAQGQVPGQPNGGRRADGTYLAPALNGTAHAWHHPPGQLVAYVKQGSPAPDSPMRGWAGKLSDEEVGAVLAYLQSLWPEPLRVRYRRMHGAG